MRFLIITVLSGLLVAGCSSSKMELGTTNQGPCQNEVKLENPGSFASETVDNLVVYKQGDEVFATMDVKSWCNARYNFAVQQVEDQIRLMMNNTGSSSGDCICEMNIGTSVKGIKAGTYTFLVMNAGGNQILAEETFTVE